MANYVCHTIWLAVNVCYRRSGYRGPQPWQSQAQDVSGCWHDGACLPSAFPPGTLMYFVQERETVRRSGPRSNQRIDDRMPTRTRPVKDAHQRRSIPQVELPAKSADHFRRHGNAYSHLDRSYPIHPRSLAMTDRHHVRPSQPHRAHARRHEGASARPQFCESGIVDCGHRIRAISVIGVLDLVKHLVGGLHIHFLLKNFSRADIA